MFRAVTERRGRRWMPHEVRILVTVLATIAPALLAIGVLVAIGDHSSRVRWTIGLLVAVPLVVGMVVLYERITRPWQTLANMLKALREGDYSLRARASGADALGLAYYEANLLGEMLRVQRLGAVEAEALLRSVMEEIDVAVFAFDERGRLVLVNRSGERLLGEPSARLLGRSASEVGLADGLRDDRPRVAELAFPGGQGRWEMRLHPFRQDGRPHTLLVAADVSTALREEELLAWQRLVRVVSHEINNSLTPIKSIACSLQTILAREPREPDADEDLDRGLAIIAGRAEALSRFMSSYARLAKLPPPTVEEVDVSRWVQRVAALDTRLPVVVEEGPRVHIRADGDQLDQLLINLVRNAVDASLETGGGVRLRWAERDDHVLIFCEDNGVGLPPSANLFVPFFTTKRGGSGIGLVLCRQIAENHGGSVTLRNRDDAPGCVATVQLPRLAAPVARRHVLAGSS